MMLIFRFARCEFSLLDLCGECRCFGTKKYCMEVEIFSAFVEMVIAIILILL